MLNLAELKNKTYEIVWFDGSVLQLRRPSQDLYERLAEMNKLKDDDIKTLMSIVYDLLFEIFNNNINGRKFTIEEIKENFDIKLAYEFMQDFSKELTLQLGK